MAEIDVCSVIVDAGPLAINGNGGSFITEINSNVGKGLSHVLSKVDTEFIELDLHDYWTDTLVRKVYIHRKCAEQVYWFFYESLKEQHTVVETGGYLIGAWDFNKENPQQYDVSLEEFIETADDAVNEKYQLNFGAKIGVRLDEKIRTIKEKTGRSLALTGWIHSHPEMNIFLSHTDLNMQEQLADSEHKGRLLALVMDTNTQQDGQILFNTGIFPYRSDYTMNNGHQSIPFLSWAALYKRAKELPPEHLSTCYPLHVKELCPASIADTIYLSNECIINFSKMLDQLPGKSHVQGVFLGKVYGDASSGKQYIECTNVFESAESSKYEAYDVVGYFYYSKGIDQFIEEILHPEHLPQEAEFLVFCDNLGKELTFIPKKASNEFARRDEVHSTVNFGRIESWPARRR